MRTNVIIVADCSGSMGHLQAKQQDLIFALTSRLGAEETAGQGQYPTRIIRFGYNVDELGAKPASAWSRFDINDIRANLGNTALMDAIGRALELTDPNVPTLINVFTDGEENASHRYNGPRIEALLKQHEAKGNLTLTVAGPHSAAAYMSRIGIPAGNFKGWDGSAAEHVTVAQTSTASLDNYIVERKAGRTRSVSYFVDPSKLNTAGVRSMAKKVEPEAVKVVDKRLAGRAIADAFPKFEKGRHYYQLLKPEYIDADKDLVVHIKDKGEYRQGSRSVRILLGLPEDGRIRVKPAKPAADQLGKVTEPNFEVFVQSASVNRKLVEGQKLLTL